MCVRDTCSGTLIKHSRGPAAEQAQVVTLPGGRSTLAGVYDCGDKFCQLCKMVLQNLTGVWLTTKNEGTV